MADDELGLGHDWRSLYLQSMRCGVGNVLVPSPWPETSPAASYRRSNRGRRCWTREDGDDRWGHPVSDSVFENEIFYFHR